MVFVNLSKKTFTLELLGVITTRKIAHLMFLIIISGRIMSLLKIDVLSSDLLIYSNNPSPFLFLSRRFRILYWSKINCELENLSSSFALEGTK